MSSSTEAIRERLMVSDQEFRQLCSEHAGYEAQLKQLSDKRFPSQQDQAQEVRLKKLKLRAKDQMEQLVHRAMKA
ncbi:MAG TPA: YdcH family protein [Terriglobia bacterium]|nr:YdcH family protein [Terriglobia bacterium]